MKHLQHMHFYIGFLHSCGLTVRKVWLASRNRLGDYRESPADHQERLVLVTGSKIDGHVVWLDFAGGLRKHEAWSCVPMGVRSGTRFKWDMRIGT